MNHKQWYFAGLVLLGYVLLLTGCDGPTNPSGDTTPPGFVQVLVQLEGPTSPNHAGNSMLRPKMLPGIRSVLISLSES